jgi:hypothetical protein
MGCARGIARGGRRTTEHFGVFTILQNSNDSPAEELKEQFDEVAEEVARNPWVERLARFGYAAKGVVYIVAGALAVMTAAGVGGELTDARGALRSIARQPFGRSMLAVVAVGLAAYVLWRWVQSITDADGKGRTLKGLALRAAYFASGTVYAGLALAAARIVFGADEPAGVSPTRSWTARLMGMPFGDWLVTLAGLSVIGFGLYQIYKGYRAKFAKRLKLPEIEDGARDWAVLAGRVGYAARGVVFAVIGLFLIRAAMYRDPGHAQGLDGALQALARQSFGPYLLGIVAAGLVAYGIFALVEARHRRIAGS